MHRRLIACVALVCALVGSALARPAGATTYPYAHLSHIYYIMMENQGFDDVIGHENVTKSPYVPDTPFITQLAFTYGLETMSFGTTHPSLPNYLSLVGGDYYGIQDDNASCYAVPKQSPCDTATGTNLVDQLEAAGMTWLDMQQTMPSAGYLGPTYPTGKNAVALYAQKHNPFLYYKDIATNPGRLKKVVPLTPSTLTATLSNPATAPNFLFLVPDLCHDMHGASTCANNDVLLREGDDYVKYLVTTITKSKAWTTDSVIIVAWDENDYSSNYGCCLSVYPHGGGHNALIVITHHAGPPIEVATPSNHYNELRSIEDAFGLPHLNNAANVVPSLNGLFYPWMVR